jgi:hypothetical protein
MNFLAPADQNESLQNYQEAAAAGIRTTGLDCGCIFFQLLSPFL